MTQIERLSQIANQLHQEDPNPIVLPITRTGQQFDLPWHARNTLHLEGGYVCRDNGVGCGKPFPTKDAKDRHRLWCKQVKQ